MIKELNFMILEIFLFNLLYNDIRVIKNENNNIKYEYVSISHRWKFQ